MKTNRIVHKKKQRSHYIVIAIAIFLTGVLIYEVVTMLNSGSGSLPVTGQVQNFSAVNAVTGKPFIEQQLTGKIYVMTWYYTHCTDLCPLTMYRFEQLQAQLKAQHLLGNKVVLVAMTLDPVRDTAPVIQQYSRHFHASQDWYFLRSTLANTDKVLSEWGVLARPSSNKEFLEHTSKTVLVDQNGNIRNTYTSANLNSGAILTDIESIVQRNQWLQPGGTNS